MGHFREAFGALQAWVTCGSLCGSLCGINGGLLLRGAVGRPNKFPTTPTGAALHVPVFALNAGKMALNHRTGQMVGMLTIVDGEITPILLGNSVVKDGHGGEAGGL